MSKIISHIPSISWKPRKELEYPIPHSAWRVRPTSKVPGDPLQPQPSSPGCLGPSRSFKNLQPRQASNSRARWVWNGEDTWAVILDIMIDPGDWYHMCRFRWMRVLPTKSSHPTSEATIDLRPTTEYDLSVIHARLVPDACTFSSRTKTPYKFIG